jgi:adenylate cyclase
MELDSWAEASRARWHAKGVNFGATRIGVHAGPALVGKFPVLRLHGLRRHREHCSQAGEREQALGKRICVSAAVAAGVDDFQGRPVGVLMLRGHSEPLRA